MQPIKQIIKVGRMTVVAGCLFAVLMAMAIDSIKGLNLFDVFQSVLGFIAPPLSCCFFIDCILETNDQKSSQLYSYLLVLLSVLVWCIISYGYFRQINILSGRIICCCRFTFLHYCLLLQLLFLCWINKRSLPMLRILIKRRSAKPTN